MNKIDKIRHGGLDYDIGDGAGGESIPAGTVVQFDGDTIPEGYEEVEVQPVYFTPTNGENYAGYGNCYYTKIGNRVHLHIGIKLSSTSSTSIFTMPEGYRPKYSDRIYIGAGGEMTSRAVLYLGIRW